MGGGASHTITDSYARLIVKRLEADLLLSCRAFENVRYLVGFPKMSAILSGFRNLPLFCRVFEDLVPLSGVKIYFWTMKTSKLGSELSRSLENQKQEGETELA